MNLNNQAHRPVLDDMEPVILHESDAMDARQSWNRDHLVYVDSSQVCDCLCLTCQMCLSFHIGFNWTSFWNN